MTEVMKNERVDVQAGDFFQENNWTEEALKLL